MFRNCDIFCDHWIKVQNVRLEARKLVKERRSKFRASHLNTLRWSKCAECISFHNLWRADFVCLLFACLLLLCHGWHNATFLGISPLTIDPLESRNPSAWPFIWSMSIVLHPSVPRCGYQRKTEVSGGSFTVHSVVWEKKKNENANPLPITLSKLGMRHDYKKEDEHIYSHRASCLQKSVQLLINQSINVRLGNHSETVAPGVKFLKSNVKQYDAKDPIIWRKKVIVPLLRNSETKERIEDPDEFYMRSFMKKSKTLR